MRKNINKTDLKELVKSYRQGLDKNETKSCMIRLVDIQSLIKQYSNKKLLNGKPAIDGFRIYFFRPEPIALRGQPGKSINKVGNKGQMSIILVPTNNYNEVRIGNNLSGAADDMFIEKGECQVFIPGGEHTGLCPKNCDGSI